MDYKQLMIDRIDRRRDKFLGRYERFKRWIEDGKIGGEANRLWVEEQISGLGGGLDICCGDFLMGENSTGVDIDQLCLGASYYLAGDALTKFGDNSCDYVVTNYLEAFVDTLKVLSEWRRVLKPGGLLVFTACDADKYDHTRLGPLENENRFHVFTKRTIQAYLARADFREVEVFDGEERSMRVRCRKK